MVSNADVRFTTSELGEYPNAERPLFADSIVGMAKGFPGDIADRLGATFAHVGHVRFRAANKPAPDTRHVPVIAYGGHLIALSPAEVGDDGRPRWYMYRCINS